MDCSRNGYCVLTFVVDLTLLSLYNIGMMKKEVSLLVYIKRKYRYTDREDKMAKLADSLQGREVGGGTCLATGKRDKQYFFKSEKDAKTFLSYPTVRETILTEYNLEAV